MIEEINAVNREELRQRVASAEPFPFLLIDDFLRKDFAEEIHRAFPSYSEVAAVGKTNRTVNEKGKFQVTDSREFAQPIRRLHEMLASEEFLEFVSGVMGIPNLLADEELTGGGIHQTGSHGILDVHVDFNYIPERQLHRRLNILIYFNKGWNSAWGGNIELWDKDVKVCRHSLSPAFNRCLIFETNEFSYHGVTSVQCPEGVSRNSFAGYYYTKEAPAQWTGESHSTIFKARPNEVLKNNLLMPYEMLSGAARKRFRQLKSGIKKIILK